MDYSMFGMGGDYDDAVGDDMWSGLFCGMQPGDITPKKTKKYMRETVVTALEQEGQVKSFQQSQLKNKLDMISDNEQQVISEAHEDQGKTAQEVSNSQSSHKRNTFPMSAFMVVAILGALNFSANKNCEENKSSINCHLVTTNRTQIQSSFQRDKCIHIY